MMVSHRPGHGRRARHPPRVGARLRHARRCLAHPARLSRALEGRLATASTTCARASRFAHADRALAGSALTTARRPISRHPAVVQHPAALAGLPSAAASSSSTSGPTRASTASARSPTSKPGMLEYEPRADRRRRAFAGVLLREGGGQREGAIGEKAPLPRRPRTTTWPPGAPGATSTGPPSTSSTRRARSATAVRRRRPRETERLSAHCSPRAARRAGPDGRRRHAVARATTPETYLGPVARRSAG